MLSFNCWILSCLLLGHLIAGVNRELITTQFENFNDNEELSKEARKILNLHLKQTDSLNFNDNEELKQEARKTPNFHFRQTDLQYEYEDSSEVISRRVRSLPESLSLVCPPYDSCGNRCNEAPRPLPYICNCDASCITFSDCCVDYKDQCISQNNVTAHTDDSLSILGLGCEILFMKYNLMTVGKCQHDYKDVKIKKLCSFKIPKYCSFPNNLNASDAERVFQKCKQSFYGSCLSKLKLNCDTNIEPLCAIMIKKCEMLASKKCYSCSTPFWPVLGKNGILYRNSYCALCNAQKSQILLSPRDLESVTKEKSEKNSSSESSMSFVRHCIPVDIDSCPETENDEMKVLCRNHTGIVIAGSGDKKTIYKNAHCAVCNGAEVKNLQCATMGSLMRGLIRPLLETFITGDAHGIKFDDIPATFSILLNFGLDGRKRMYFSSEGEEEMKRNQERCGKGRIWDPFSEVCRQLYCSTEFVLVDYRCVRKEIPADKESIPRNESTVIPDAKAEFVHLTLSAEMEVLDILQFHGQDIDTICETIRKSLAKSFNIHIERIKNVQFNITLGFVGDLEEIRRFIEEMDELHPITFKIEFDLYEDFEINATEPEPTVDRIVSMLASSLSINGFEIDINNATSRIFEIHQSVSPLESWCTPANRGKKKEYWNSEFSLILDDDNSTMRENRIKGIYVNRTGKFYPRGKFVADILFQGYQFSNSLINVSGVAIVCDEIKLLNESCTRILIGNNEFTLFENGTVSIYNESLRNLIDGTDYELSENNSLWVCLKPLKGIISNKHFNIELDLVQGIVSYVLLWVSVLGMAIVLATYFTFESLRNLPGCNTMNLTFSLMAMQITFLFGERSTVRGTACIVVGHLFHYEILCSFMWMNVMAFDLFRSFGNKNILSSIRSKRKYLPKYMIYAYLSPISIILTASLIDYFLNDSLFAPNYGKNNLCWISNPYASIIFFAVPLAIIMCVNFILFLMTIFSMRSVKQLSNIKDLKTNRNGKNDLFLYARMALLIGLTWLLAFAAAYVSKTELIGQILTYLYIIFNTLQGVFLFWIFVCNKRVYGLYKEGFRNLLRKISMHAKYESSSATIARFSDGIKRSVSTNTVVSTVSNTSASSNESQLSTIQE